MASSSLPTKPLLLFTALSFLLLLLPLGSLSKKLDTNPVLKYHNGPLLTGEIKLSILWYGRFGRIHKSVLRDFIRSLNHDGNSNMDYRVSTWWKTIESYQSAIPRNNQKKIPKIRVRIARQKTDLSYSVGKVVTPDFFPGLVQKATGGLSSSVAVIFTARDVSIVGTCMGRCSQHGTVGTGKSRSIYMFVGNPETECPATCAWPFHKADYGPQTIPLQPPNGNVGADAMVIGFATALAETVTNPYNTGFFKGSAATAEHRLEAVSACPGIFGSGAFPGYTGKVRIAPGTGGCFNAHGVNRRKFLLPAVWNPKTAKCWTIM